MAKKILITDDEHDLVDAMKIRFEEDGYTVVTAYNGEECLGKARKDPPDLLITDVAMPRMDGYTVVKEMRVDSKLRHIPIIILTGKDEMEDIFKMEGVEEYVVKPYEYEVLLKIVKKLLGRK